MSLKELAKMSKPHDHRKARVVVVDDDQAVLSALRVVLSRHFEVECFVDPVSGARAAAKPNTSVAILDVRMPNHDGFWVYRKIRESNTRVQVIFNTAYQDAKDMVEVDEMYRPFAYNRKGKDLSEFIRLVEAAAAAYSDVPA